MARRLIALNGRNPATHRRGHRELLCFVWTKARTNPARNDGVGSVVCPVVPLSVRASRACLSLLECKSNLNPSIAETFKTQPNTHARACISPSYSMSLLASLCNSNERAIVSGMLKLNVRPEHRPTKRKQQQQQQPWQDKASIHTAPHQGTHVCKRVCGHCLRCKAIGKRVLGPDGLRTV